MLKKIRLQNFLSFKDETIELNPNANVLVGINGSGKTNFLKAIRILAAAFSENVSFENLISKLGGYDLIKYNKSHESEDIKITYFYECILGNDMEFSVLEYSITIQKYDFISENVQFIRFNRESPITIYDNFILYDLNEKEIKRFSSGSNSRNVIFSKNYVYDSSDDYLIRNELSRIDFFGNFNLSEGSPLLKAGEASIAQRLASDGVNYIPMLNNIKLNFRKYYLVIQDYFLEINANYQEIDFQHLGLALGIILIEKKSNKNITIEYISDGTIKFLILLIAILNPNHGKLICFDEPDTYLHFTMVNKFVDLVKESDSQFIITTHNPEVVSLFGLDSVIAFERTEDGSKIFKPDPIKKYGDELASWGAGSLWVNGYFDLD